MANQLKVSKVQSINDLHALGWSQRRIARELGISRGAVARNLRGGEQETKAPTGSEAPGEASNRATPVLKAPTGSEVSNRATNTFKAPTGSRSRCGRFHDLILEKLRAGLSAQRIYQDLVADHGFQASYPSVRRYVARLGKSCPIPFRRMEVGPGEEAQIDFGKGAPLVGEEGQRQRTHVIRVVLSHSRKGYSEAVMRQTTECFVRCLENAFHHFGGVPKTLVPDNLKAAVLRTDWYDPDLNPKLQSFCDHYGTVLLPTKPRTPRHKGKVERGVDYVQENALKGRTFRTLHEQNEFLLHWEATVADTRIHGTTRRQVSKAFEEQERSALASLPATRFPCFREEQRKVCRDGHLSVDKSYYSVPPEYLGHILWVRWDSRMVRIYDNQMKLVCSHATRPPGLFSTLREHIASEKISDVERGIEWLLDKIELIGPQTTNWAKGCIASRGVQAARVLQGLLRLTGKHRSHQLEAACETAHANQCYRLRSVQRLIEHAACKQRDLGFLEEHPLIRNLSEYESVVRVDLGKEAIEL